MPIEATKTAITRDPILVDLALQGGGSHGAFTWGVLDRLLEEQWLGIDGISGTSAGAMNAAVLVDGFAKGGALGAREALETFWRRVSEAARFSPLRRGPLDARFLAGLCRPGSPLAPGVSLRPQSSRQESAARRFVRPHRFRAASASSDQAFHYRHQRQDRTRSCVQEQRDHGRCAARLGLSADDVSGDRN